MTIPRLRLGGLWRSAQRTAHLVLVADEIHLVRVLLSIAITWSAVGRGLRAGLGLPITADVAGVAVRIASAADIAAGGIVAFLAYGNLRPSGMASRLASGRTALLVYGWAASGAALSALLLAATSARSLSFVWLAAERAPSIAAPVAMMILIFRRRQLGAGEFIEALAEQAARRPPGPSGST